MKPDRTDIYARIHKGLRKALFEFSELAGKVNSESTSEMNKLNQLGKRVFEFLELHAEIEEKFQLPMLEALNPDFVITDHHEHQQLEEVISNLKEALDQLTGTRSMEEDAYRFYLQLNEFIGRYLLHMDHEETITAQLFMHYCRDDEMQHTIEAINAFTTPEQKLLALHYFMPAITQQERINFLKGVKANNSPAFREMMKQIQTLLPVDDWINLANGMEDEDMENVSTSLLKV